MAVDPSDAEMRAAVVSALLGAVVGGLVAYALGFLQAVRDRRRQRRAVATALLYEFHRARDLALVLRDHPNAGNVQVFVPTEAVDKFLDHVALFEPGAVAAVLEAGGSMRYLRQDWHNAPESTVDPGHPRHGFMQRLARTLLEQLGVARPLLRDAGGVAPPDSASKQPGALVEPRDDRPPPEPRAHVF